MTRIYALRVDMMRIGETTVMLKDASVRAEAETDTLLKWITEELLGYNQYLGPRPFHGVGWIKGSDVFTLDTLLSWHGIGLVVAEMERRGWHIELSREDSASGNKWRAAFVHPEGEIGYRALHAARGLEPWVAVFAAARKAVEGR